MKSLPALLISEKKSKFLFSLHSHLYHLLSRDSQPNMIKFQPRMIFLALPITWWNSFEFILSTVSPRKTSYCWWFRNPKHNHPGIYFLKKNTCKKNGINKPPNNLNLVSQPPPDFWSTISQPYHQPPNQPPLDQLTNRLRWSRCQSCNLLILFHCCNTIHLLERAHPSAVRRQDG